MIYYQSRQDLKEAQAKIWVVDKNFRPYIADARQYGNYNDRIFEYEEAVREFYENALSCDDSYIRSDRFSHTLERALHLSIEFINGQTIEDFWIEENITTNVLENNWVYRGMVDSILFDLNSTPIRGYAFGKQQIHMRRQRLTRNLHISFVLYDVARRTRQNPFAVKLDELDIFNNTVISIKRD